MNTYISIVRGINVTGHKPVRMEALRKTYEGLHFINVQTYIQSGNVIFQDERSDLKELEKMIIEAIKRDFGYDVTVFVLDSIELKDIIRRNPFKDDSTKEKTYLHVTFLAKEPEDVPMDVLGSKAGPGEALAREGRAVYLYCPNGYGKSGLKNDILERILKLRATTRNWRTVQELLRIAEGYGKD